MEVKRVKLRDWLTLADLREDMLETKVDIGNKLLAYLRIGTDIDQTEERLPWYKIREAFSLCLELNKINFEFPILKQAPKRKGTFAWEYKGRDWYYWLNLFASHYGWNVSEVADLDIDDAIGLLGEIELDDQFEKEWEHGLSELSYPYDSATKKNRFVPLQRPRWMNKLPDVSKLTRRIPKSLLPVGIVQKVEVDENKNPLNN